MQVSAVTRAVLLTAAMFAAAGCSITVDSRGTSVAGALLPPRPARAERTFTAFDRLRVEGPIDVVVRVGTLPAVTFEGDEERLGELTAELISDGGGSTLLVRSEPGAPWNDGPRAVVGMPGLALLVSAGSGWIAVSGLAESTLDVRLLGSGDVLLRGRVAELVTTVEGTGRIEASSLETP